MPEGNETVAGLRVPEGRGSVGASGQDARSRRVEPGAGDRAVVAERLSDRFTGGGVPDASDTVVSCGDYAGAVRAEVALANPVVVRDDREQFRVFI